MNTLLKRLTGKKSRLVVGLLSGTSVDSVDAVLVKITGQSTNTSIKILDFTSQKIPNKIRLAVFRNSDAKTAKIEDICRLNVIIGALFADAVLKLLKRNNLKASQVDLIGSHGQTIHHIPKRKDFHGYRVKSTMQIGDPSVIANLTGVTTIGDFRIADCAVGGDGAPLVPYLDYVLFSDKRLNRGLLNIGGISNITVIPGSAKKEDVIAFDTGPGNMLIDGMMYHLYRKKFDRNGSIAIKGRVNRELFSYLLRDNIYRMFPPKSTGREHYGTAFQKKLLKRIKGMRKSDVICTVTEFTAYTIWFNYSYFIKPVTRIHELLISGGGAKNRVLMNTLKTYFKGVKLKAINKNGINAGNKEAVLFAVLANECIGGISTNMKSVTGSGRDVILGKICQSTSF
jgi:anhydro-N-acetylmuramic acid kinase